MSVTYNVIDHYDVWAETESSYVVNASRNVGTITVEEDTEPAIFQALKDQVKLFSQDAKREAFEFEWQDEGVLYINSAATGEPFCTLNQAGDDDE